MNYFLYFPLQLILYLEYCEVSGTSELRLRTSLPYVFCSSSSIITEVISSRIPNIIVHGLNHLQSFRNYRGLSLRDTDLILGIQIFSSSPVNMQPSYTSPVQWFSNCSPWASITGNTWEFTPDRISHMASPTCQFRDYGGEIKQSVLFVLVFFF